MAPKEDSLRLWKYTYKRASINLPRYCSPEVGTRDEWFYFVAGDRDNAADKLAKIRQNQIKADLRAFSECNGIENLTKVYTSELRTLDERLSEFNFSDVTVPILKEDVDAYLFSLSIKSR